MPDQRVRQNQTIGPCHRGELRVPQRRAAIRRLEHLDPGRGNYFLHTLRLVDVRRTNSIMWIVERPMTTRPFTRRDVLVQGSLAVAGLALLRAGDESGSR